MEASPSSPLSRFEEFFKHFYLHSDTLVLAIKKEPHNKIVPHIVRSVGRFSPKHAITSLVDVIEVANPSVRALALKGIGDLEPSVLREIKLPADEAEKIIRRVLAVLGTEEGGEGPDATGKRLLSQQL
jgi:hypothetical protein